MIPNFKHPRLDLTRERIRDHQRTPYERVFSAFIYCMKLRDYEAAAVLRDALARLEGREP